MESGLKAKGGRIDAYNICNIHALSEVNGRCWRVQNNSFEVNSI